MDSTVALVAGIVSAAAAVVAVVWAMIGNPDLRNVFGGWAQKRRLSVKKVERRVVRVDGHSIDAAAKTFLGANTIKYDLVVGLHPDGVSIASTIARRTDSRFATIEKVYPGMFSAARYL